MLPSVSMVNNVWLHKQACWWTEMQHPLPATAGEHRHTQSRSHIDPPASSISLMRTAAEVMRVVKASIINTFQPPPTGSDTLESISWSTRSRTTRRMPSAGHSTAQHSVCRSGAA